MTKVQRRMSTMMEAVRSSTKMIRRIRSDPIRGSTTQHNGSSTSLPKKMMKATKASLRKDLSKRSTIQKFLREETNSWIWRKWRRWLDKTMSRKESISRRRQNSYYRVANQLKRVAQRMSIQMMKSSELSTTKTGKNFCQVPRIQNCGRCAWKRTMNGLLWLLC